MRCLKTWLRMAGLLSEKGTRKKNGNPQKKEKIQKERNDTKIQIRNCWRKRIHDMKVRRKAYNYQGRL